MDLGAGDSLASRRFGCSICFSCSNYPIYLRHETSHWNARALSHEGNVNGRLPIRTTMGTISLPPYMESSLAYLYLAYSVIAFKKLIIC
jgi:hypothetical protein